MSYVYKPFSLETWVTNFYKRMGIYQPNDINEKVIARNLRIYLKYSERRSYSVEDCNFKLINIDSRLLKEQQREHFFHELCHILRHCGYQLMMSKAFRELQEWDANHFTRYAAIPFHMLKFIDLKNPYVVSNMADTFKVSEEICEYRLEHIHRNKIVKT